MKLSSRAWPIPLLLGCLSSCGSGGPAATPAAAAAVAGVYRLDSAAFAADFAATGGGASEPQMSATRAFLAKTHGSIELRPDGTMSFVFRTAMPMAPATNEQGNWQLEGSVLHFTTRQPAGEQRKVAKCENGSITIEEQQLGKPVKMVFRKQ